MTAPGRLRTRAVLESAADTPDGAGGVTKVWSAEATFWAEVVPERADRVLPADGVRQRITHKVMLRHRTDVTLAKRLRIGARVLDIHAIHDPDERGVWLACDCEERS